MEIRSITEIYNFFRAPVVGVPITEVTKTLVSWLRWMVSSYVGRLDTKTTSLRSACLNTPGLAISWYDYGPANLVERPWMCDLPRSVCSCSPASLLWTPKDFTSGMRPPCGVRA
jgi:hypothetical protein